MEECGAKKYYCKWSALGGKYNVKPNFFGGLGGSRNVCILILQLKLRESTSL